MNPNVLNPLVQQAYDTAARVFGISPGLPHGSTQATQISQPTVSQEAIGLPSGVISAPALSPQNPTLQEARAILPDKVEQSWWSGWGIQPNGSMCAPQTRGEPAIGYSLLTTPGNGLHPAEDLLEDYRLF